MSNDIRAEAAYEAIRRAPVPDNAHAHYRIGFREATDWIATNCIIIPRTDLPEATEGEGLVVADSHAWPSNGTADLARRKARAYLALAEYLDAHPPVDEAQVNALALALCEDRNGGSIHTRDAYREEARRLVQRGVTVKES